MILSSAYFLHISKKGTFWRRVHLHVQIGILTSDCARFAEFAHTRVLRASHKYFRESILTDDCLELDKERTWDWVEKGEAETRL